MTIPKTVTRRNTMSIEALLTSLKESVDRNTEALLAVAAAGGKPAAAAESAPSTGKSGKGGKAGKTEAAETAATSAGPKHTQDEVNAALIKIKDDFGLEHAKVVIKEVGKVDKMGDIPADKYDAVYEAAVAKHAELSAAGGGEEEGGL